MAKLVITKSGQQVSEYELVKGVTTLGRKPNNDIWLNDVLVSRLHAKIVQGQSTYIEDAGSRNGLLLQGKKVQRIELHGGEEVQIGPYSLRYVSDEGMASEDKPSLASDGLNKTQAIHTWDVSQGKGAPLGMARIIEGEGTGNVLDLRDPFTAVGKMGQQVAVITRRPEGYSIRSVSGKMDTLKVNGEAVHKSMHDLVDGDVVEVSGIKISFMIIGGG